uniref:Copia protein n=1 Tax=Cajanus cajan TaxID=3821 RepID=A0A151TNS6_CAJCA|nr:Copia protein [Cajanus cajan]
MKSFLIGRKLWRIVTSNIKQPTKEASETDAKFANRLENWDSKNHQVITWFHNTSSPSIHIQFATYDSAKEIWDFLSSHYETTGLAHYYQLWTTLHNTKQESDQSVNDFLAQVQPIWHQLSQAKISEDHLHTAMQEIIFEETRLNLNKPNPLDATLAIARFSQQKSSYHPCKIFNRTGHVFANCPIIECIYCHNIGHILENCPTRPPKPNSGTFKPKVVKKNESHISATAIEGSTSITMSDIDELLHSKKQTVVSRSSTESEYHALADATSVLLWLRWLLTDMSVAHPSSTKLHCDNKSVIHISHHDVFHERTKHI